MATRARKLVHKIVTGSSIMTWIGVTVIDIVFTVESLEPFWTIACVLAN